MTPRPRHPRNAPRRRAAFTLVEVMVAVLILAVGLAGLARGIATALASGKEAEVHTQAVELAANRVEMLRADEWFLDGDSDGDAGPFHWRQSIAPSTVDGLHQVEVSVERTGRPGAIYTLRTLLYLEPADRAAAKERDRDKRGDKRRPGGRDGGARK